MNTRHTMLLLVTFAALSLFALGARAQSILIAPGSLVLTDAQRTGSISIANTEGHKVSFRVEPALFRMRSDGFLEEVADMPQSAAGMIRFAPRQFELEPGGSQVVRVAFRAPAGLPAGEYRMHLRMRNMGAPVAAASSAAEAESAVVAGEIQLQIPVTVARAARILVRHGVGAGHVGLDSLQVSRVTTDSARVDLSLLNKHDGGSANGTLEFSVDDSAPVAGSDMRRRYSVYADLDRRDYQVIVPIPAGKPTKVCVRLVPDGASDRTAGEQRCGSV